VKDEECACHQSLLFLGSHQLSKVEMSSECQWLTSIILATQEAEIRRIEVQSQTRQIVHETLPRKNPSQKRAGGVAHGVGPEFKPQYWKKTVEMSLSCRKAPQANKMFNGDISRVLGVDRSE
jgi:hypothetical protein